METRFDYNDKEISVSAIDNNMVKNLSDPICEVVSGNTVEYSDYWSIASGFADHMEDNLSEENNIETAEFYSRTSSAVLGTTIGAELGIKTFLRRTWN